MPPPPWFEIMFKAPQLLIQVRLKAIAGVELVEHLNRLSTVDTRIIESLGGPIIASISNVVNEGPDGMNWDVQFNGCSATLNTKPKPGDQILLWFVNKQAS